MSDDVFADLEAAAAAVAELSARFCRELESRRVAPAVDRSAARALFDGTLGEEGIGLRSLVDELSSRALPAAMTTPHPLYFGLVNSSPLPGGVLADLLVSATNNNGGAFHQSPGASAAEEEVVRAFAALVGDGFSGMLLPGGTWANLQALVLARASRFPDWSVHGPAAITRAPRLYATASSHFCVERSAEVIGLGRHGTVEVPATGRGAMDVAALRALVADDRESGREPFAVVATAGTTGTGAIDPLEAIADFCADEGLWLHVDACYGGAGLLLDELRPRYRGIARADSVSVDPHKWFFIPMTAGLLLTRHARLEEDTFRAPGASYIPQDGVVDPFLRGIPTSRRASGLTVWAALRAHGWTTIREAVRRNVELTRRLERALVGRGFRVLPDGELSVACARWEPSGRSAAELEALQQRIAARVADSGRAWFGTTRHAGLTWLRFNTVNLHVRERHVDALAEIVAEAAHAEG